MSQDTRERMIHEARIKARRDRDALLLDAFERGVSHGELAGKVRLLQELLGLSVASREELTALAPDELLALADRLKQQAKARS